MNSLLLQPLDVLSFRDGRPMTGSSAGHGAAWPLPHVIHAAVHAALHRAFEHDDKVGSVHPFWNRNLSSGKAGYDEKLRKRFGSVWTAGPFPVLDPVPSWPDVDTCGGGWYFPRPADAQLAKTCDVTHRPFAKPAHSSIPKELDYVVASSLEPEKESAAEPWLSRTAFDAYLRGKDAGNDPGHFLPDSAFGLGPHEAEHRYGIARDHERQSVIEGAFYSAHFLRLKPRASLGILAGGIGADADALGRLFPQGADCIVVGGESRPCRAEYHACPDAVLPVGLREDFPEHPDRKGAYLVKWVLLTPSIWPARPDDGHCGGWLPSWVKARDDRRAPECPPGQVLLRQPLDSRPVRRSGGVRKSAWRGQPMIHARLVAAIHGKPHAVTGWTLGDQASGEASGAQSLHLAVPAGAVYYFEAASRDAATQLADALNWHGSDLTGTTIRNRRTELCGEKGFGLGVCAGWEPYRR